MENSGYEKFKQKVLLKTGIDLNSYKQQQMQRRIETFMRTLNIDNYDSFFSLLEKDHNVYQKFLDRLTINVSEFFRNPERYEELKTKFIPEIIKTNPNLKVWSAGCSTGEEPYSLAILLEEMFPGNRFEIIATDLDKTILKKAQEGIYTEKHIANIPPKLIQKYFSKVNDSFQVKESIRKKINFRHHNLLKDKFEPNCDLILCRNVVIYFTEEAKDILYQNFYKSLNINGILFVGSTERIINYQEIGFKNVSSFFYQRVYK